MIMHSLRAELNAEGKEQTWQVEVLAGGLELLVVAGHDGAVVHLPRLQAPLRRQVSFHQCPHHRLCTVSIFCLALSQIRKMK